MKWTSVRSSNQQTTRQHGHITMPRDPPCPPFLRGGNYARLRLGQNAFFLVLTLLTALPLLADEPASAVGPLMKLYQSGRLSAERQPAVVEMICNRGNERDLRVVFDKVIAPDGMSEPLRQIGRAHV